MQFLVAVKWSLRGTPSYSNARLPKCTAGCMFVPMAQLEDETSSIYPLNVSEEQTIGAALQNGRVNRTRH